MCEFPGCLIKRPSHNFPGIKKGKYCVNHSEDGMINVLSPKCLDCGLRPNYNFKGIRKAIYCVTHKKEGMIDVNKPPCLECDKRPSFNLPGNKKAIYCFDHKKDNMINVISVRCLECDKLASYNFSHIRRPDYCFDHKKDEMINVAMPKCLECGLRPTFNSPGNTQPIYCLTHRKEGMVDVINPKCLECDTRPSHNFPNQTKSLYCSSHSKEGMINITSNKCIEDDCLVKCYFNYEGEKKGLYCFTHKKEGMIDVINPKCKTHLCGTNIVSLGKKYEGYCYYCYANIYPDSELIRNYKTKERKVGDFLKENFGELNWINDKIIEGGISRRRPDFLINLEKQVIIVDIDENQHTNYDCICENKRIMEISKDFEHKPVVFIRFNPDSYKNSKGEKIKSCWEINTLGLCVVKKKETKTWNNRLEILGDQINYWLENDTDKTIEIIHLFYDGF